mmetsp:Transcript_27905/g.85209  ORF Transcript_27905/g.85209 Transcript_27905/m.85209 type:complete len:88 (-) Transcript_27905:686-949(-)
MGMACKATHAERRDVCILAAALHEKTQYGSCISHSVGVADDRERRLIQRDHKQVLVGAVGFSSGIQIFVRNKCVVIGPSWVKDVVSL